MHHSTTTWPARAACMACALLAYVASPAQAQTFPSLLPVQVQVPDGPSGPNGETCNGPGTLSLPLPVSGITAPLAAVAVDITMNATYAGDLILTLVAPGGGPSTDLVGRVGKTTLIGFGDSSRFDGTYRFVDPAVSTANIWTAAAAVGPSATIQPGTYATTQVGGAGVSSPAPTTPLLAVFAGLDPAGINGIWTLFVKDCSSGDRITVSAASLTLAARSATTPGGVTPVPALGAAGLALASLLAASLGARRLRRPR